MAENSKIEWTDHTFNPWMGCTKVSPACKNCYAERDMDHRYHKVQWGPNGTRVMTSDDNWKKPVYWNQNAVSRGDRTRVFCASLADVFEDWQGPILNHRGEQRWIVSECGKETWISGEETDQNQLSKQVGVRAATMGDVRRRLFELIDATPNLDWLLLTKRPENIRRMWPSQDWQTPSDVPYRQNVWLGTSVENQEYADSRVPKLLDCRQLASVLFLSCEPLVGPVDLTMIATNPPYEGIDALGGQCFDFVAQATRANAKIDWVIAGGESGNAARPSHPDWFRSMRDQCKVTGVPFLFKQWGEWLPMCQGGTNGALHEWIDGAKAINVGKRYAGRLLDGRAHDGLPLVACDQYGVILVQKFGDDSGGHMRWRKWEDAARFGEGMVREGNALGFRVFKEAAI